MITSSNHFNITKQNAYELYRTMYKIHELFMSFKIQYAITGGTLIGAVRHKGIIPWDNDIDIETNYKNYKIIESKKFRLAANKQKIKILKHPEGWIKFKSMIGKYKVEIDLFPIKLYKNHIKLYGGAGELWSNIKYNVDNYFPLKKYKFGDMNVLAPKNPTKLLKPIYGKDVLKVGYITQTPDEHEELDKPVKLKVTKFLPAQNFYKPSKLQTFIKSKKFYTLEYYKKCSGKLNCLIDPIRSDRKRSHTRKRSGSRRKRSVSRRKRSVSRRKRSVSRRKRSVSRRKRSVSRYSRRK